MLDGGLSALWNRAGAFVEGNAPNAQLFQSVAWVALLTLICALPKFVAYFNLMLLYQKGMVEKPKVEDAPSPYAAAGRYLLDRAVFDALRRIDKGAGGEIQLTDAIADEIEEGRDVFGLRFRGQRYDCGSKAGFLQATVAFGLAREELRDEFADYLADVMAMRKAAE